MSVPARVPPLDPDAEESGRLARRLRLAITLCVAPIIAFAVLDLALLPRDELWAYWALKLAALAVIGVSAALLHERRGRVPLPRRSLISIGLLCVAAMYALSTASAVMVREGQTTVIMSLAVALATATLLPWGIGPQIVVVAIAALSCIVTVYASDGSLSALLQYPMVGLVVGLAVSIYVAAEFSRSRAALAQRQQEQRRAEAEVRQLNEELEARVRERTAELERVNRELQAQIAERERTAAELRQSQAAVAAVIENAADAIWAVDRDAQLVLSNAALRQRVEDHFGFRLRPDGAYPPEIRAAFEDYWLPLYARGLAGERFTAEQQVEVSGQTRTYVNAFNPIVVDGRVSGLAVFSSDVTERRQAEEAARQHQAELTHVLRLSTMGEMASGLAHEINQPLAAIVNYARGSGHRLRANPGEVATVLPVIDSIATEALRAGEIIRRLRQLIRKEAPRHESLDLNELVRDAARVVEPEARQQGIEMALYLDQDLPAPCGDAIQIEQVVLNLLRNAIEAMQGRDGRRELQVTTRQTPDAAVELAVRDTGPGLPTGVTAEIFEPFYSTKTSGLGMGLSISRTIVESHGGRIAVAANHGPGVTFRVTLPSGEGWPAAVASAAARR